MEFHAVLDAAQLSARSRPRACVLLIDLLSLMS